MAGLPLGPAFSFYNEPCFNHLSVCLLEQKQAQVFQLSTKGDSFGEPPISRSSSLADGLAEESRQFLCPGRAPSI